MASHHRPQLSRLDISGPPSLNMQQPMAFDPRGQSMFSPALPTSIQQGFHPPFPVGGQSALQTPMQPLFPSQPPGAPGRPSYAQHRGGQASIAQLAAAGIHPPNGIPMTPVGQGFQGPGMPFAVHGPAFIPRNRRGPSISLGGPPKAVLGGPNRKVSPLPPTAAEVTPAVTAVKAKKVVVKFPRETVVGDDIEQPATRPLWARTPLPLADVLDQPLPEPPQLTTAEVHPSDAERYALPDTLEVFLPGKTAWDNLKKLAMEEKLQKLGVEPGSGSSVVHIHAPHGRAASISSPADSALLYFKLNKLQQSQTASSSNSLSSSPQPPFHSSSSPNNQLPPRMQNRHGHAMSLAQAPTHQSSFYNPSAFNPFSPNRDSPVTIENIHAPQGRVPVAASSLALPPSSSRPDSRPDFARGFGLDVPEEDEEPEEFVVIATDASQEVNGMVSTDDGRADGEQGEEQDGMTTVAHSAHHSRHVSNAMSVGSIQGVLNAPSSDWSGLPASRSLVGNPDIDDLDQDAIGEWTGSEDLHHSDMSDDEESIGEWSNPSDEERARQERAQLRRAKREIEGPRRIPNFPRPPENTIVGGIPAEDDIISNPSEEDHMHMGRDCEFLGIGPSEYYDGPSSVASSGRNRPLPLPPHSRGMSGQHSISEHDPALAHSRAPSQPFVYPGLTRAPPFARGQSPTLNPNAKPFVFGTASQSGSWASGAFGGTSTPPPSVSKQSPFGHSRMPSLGKPLNAAAQEFRPGGFTFRPPPAAPQMTFPAPEASRPLPMPPTGISSSRAMQGREKRQRRASHDSFDGGDEDEKSNMSSFRFPSATESPKAVRRSAPTTPRILGSRRQSLLNASAQPFTFNGFSSVPADPSIPLPLPLVSLEDPDGGTIDSSTPKAEGGEPSVRNLPIPPSAKQKRAPIPLDFTNPTHGSTVLAGLFKAVVNGDERTRLGVRSRFGSRENLEHKHTPLVDDPIGPSISRKASRPRLTEPMHSRELSGNVKDLFSPAVRRRSSFPRASSPLSDISLPAGNLTKHFESQQFEQKLAALFDEKIEIIRREGPSSLANSWTDTEIAEVFSLFKTQLEKDAARERQDSSMDARGEIDFEVIRDVIQEGNTNATNLIRQELADAVKRLEEAATHQQGLSSDSLHVLEQHNDKIIQAVATAISKATTQMETSQNDRSSSEFEREALLHDFKSILGPMIAGLRAEAVDYDLLTQQLSQAVKPHISQLIDLASDKRETATLIVDSIIPLLPSPHSYPVLETETITKQFTSEIRKAIAPIDAHEIKEQVADLVVERLDSRLAVRDKAFNVESIAAKITESIILSIEPTSQVVTALDNLIDGQKILTSQNDELASSSKCILGLLSDLPAKLATATEAIDIARVELLSRPEMLKEDAASSESISHIESTVDSLTSGQKAISLQTNELLTLQQDVLVRLSAIPEALSTATGVLQNAHAEFASSRDASKHDLDEIRRLKTQNAEIQVQLAKARGAHGQVRVEKDNLVEKIGIVESDRDRCRSQLEELQTSSTAQAINTATIESRNSELEEALSRALARLKASDVAAQTHQERITELEKINCDYTVQNQNLKSKADALELQATLTARDRDAVVEAQKLLQKEYDRVISQQTHWDDLHRAAEQIEMLTTLIGQADNEEVKELKRIRDRTNKLESDHTALQKRFKDQESKVANSERAAVIARQSLAQAQQRASEWERRAKEHEGELEMTRTKLDHADQTHAQLDADYSLAKLQLEEREADDRLAKDRENNLRNQVNALQASVTRLEADLAKAKAAAAVPFIPSAHQNGYTPSPPRPDSRTSTAYGVSRSGTPIARMNGSSIRSNTPPQSSVWDPMHVPHSKLVSRHSHLGPTTAKARNSSYHPQIPSPTPSTISLTPTQGNDGWWS